MMKKVVVASSTTKDIREQTDRMFCYGNFRKNFGHKDLLS
jgi:hypothetical protein